MPAVGTSMVLADVAVKICDVVRDNHRCFKSIAEIKKRLKTKYRVKRDAVKDRGKIDCIQDVCYRATLEQEESFVGYKREAEAEGGGPAPKTGRLF